MFQGFYPDCWCGSACQIDYEELYRQGYRALLYDIDNTLVPHGAPADEASVELFGRLHAMGFSTCLVSNNQMPRVKPFAERVESAFLVNAHKPSVKGYRQACKVLGLKTEQAVFIGDQLFTDIWGARRAGLRTILVQPIHPKEEIQIILKRRLEWIILAEYRKTLRKKGVQKIPEGKFQSEKKR
ncbi:MAG: YqeG family HAD IIIA-type phosphatase [Eubacterium sp.]|nr:YqeG family HAD IIIA-type phosphatase [Eubacterium sp.]